MALEGFLGGDEVVLGLSMNTVLAIAIVFVLVLVGFITFRTSAGVKGDSNGIMGRLGLGFNISKGPLGEGFSGKYAREGEPDHLFDDQVDSHRSALGVMGDGVAARGWAASTYHSHPQWRESRGLTGKYV